MNEIDFTINVETQMANAIRRTMLSKIPNMAIDNVCFYENESDMCDEMISSRLGLVPLLFKNLESAESAEVTLDLVGPRTIYSRDINISEGIKPADPDIILVKLGPGLRLKFKGSLSVGTANKHAKYDVCCGTTFKKLGPDSYQFHVETCGSYPADKVFLMALDIMKKTLQSFRL